VADLSLGKMLDKGKRTRGTPMPYLRNINVRWDAFDLSDLFEMPFEAHEMERYAVRAGDVVVCEGGEPGRAAVWQGEPMMFQKALHRVRPRTGVLDPRWIVWQLRHDASSGRLSEWFTGTTIKHLTGSALARYEIALPPIAEQRRIVAKLDELLASSRAVRAALDAVPALLEQYRQAVLAAAFRGDLTNDWRLGRPAPQSDARAVLRKAEAARRDEWRRSKARGTYPEANTERDGPSSLPPGWQWASLEQLTSAVASICYGVVQPGEESPGGVRLVRVCDVEGGRVRMSELRTIALEVDAEYSRSRLRGGEVLVTVVGTIGRVAVAPAAVAGANIARAVARLCPVVPMASEWIAYALMAPEAQAVLTQESREVARKTLNVGSLAQVLIPVAPEDEMREIGRRVTLHLASIERQLTTVFAAHEQLDRLEQATLTKAFEGVLVPQDPGDEPAAALLARIRSERASAPAPRSRRRTPARA
jgi:type I restriction enzyme, S subunit